MDTDMAKKTRTILVDGDVVVDHNIYLGCCHHPADGGDGTRILLQRGGAGLTADLVTALCESEPGHEARDGTPPMAAASQTDSSVHHSYATWAPFPVEAGKKSPRVWRVKEAIGFGSGDPGPKEGQCGKAGPEPGTGDLLVIDETGFGYRNRPHCWPVDLDEGATSTPWIVLRMSHPVCKGELWARLNQARFLDRLVVVVTAEDLRRAGASVTRGLSWEKTVVELLGDLAYHPEIHQLAKARHVVVEFGHEGALWIDQRDRERPRRQLIFDPGHLEGSWQEDLEGSVTGAGSCLTAAVARALAETDGEDLGSGIVRGLEAGRALLQAGHGSESTDAPRFPVDKVVKVMRQTGDGDFRRVQVPDIAIPASPGAEPEGRPPWSIIVGDPPEGHRPLYGRARKVAREGERALSGIPFGRFGKLYTVDRHEMMGYTGIRKLMVEYVGEKDPGQPLSLGVFGPPGSGKSFGLKQIVKGILGKNTPIMTFNLSQFTGPEMLAGALHQIRDEVLKGHIPVAIWDEFDSRDLMWLQYMLAPMNDGEFLEGQVTHPIGKCIFVFAGGTADSLEDFARREEGAELRDFVNAKGPDFVSRLKGYLNVLGPNPRQVEGVVDETDVGFPIRRAIMLRVLAGRFGSAPMTIDPGLLNAMLKIGKFKHGARSMATIIKGITGDGQRPLIPSNLPPREQMGLHVDVDEFMRLVQENTLFKLNTLDLAPHVHEFYLELSREEGWTPEYPMPWDELPDGIRQDNVAAARRMVDVLGLAGLVVRAKGEKPKTEADLVKRIIEDNLEILAEAEHDGWMDFKLASGWRHGEKRDDKKKIHPSIELYQDLDEADKNKDRNAVRQFPEMVERAGFEIRLEGL